MDNLTINELANAKFHELLNEMYPEGYTQEQHDGLKLMYISGIHDGINISSEMIGNTMSEIITEEK